MSENNNLVEAMNARLAALFDSGEQATLTIVPVRPQLHITSFEPLEYGNFGMIRDKSPLICGELTLRAFLLRDHPDGTTRVYGGVQDETTGYGILIDANVVDKMADLLDCAESDPESA